MAPGQELHGQRLGYMCMQHSRPLQACYQLHHNLLQTAGCGTF